MLTGVLLLIAAEGFLITLGGLDIVGPKEEISAQQIPRNRFQLDVPVVNCGTFILNDKAFNYVVLSSPFLSHRGVADP